jgi:uroporphyrin-3 C-methyltransferase
MVSNNDNETSIDLPQEGLPPPVGEEMTARKSTNIAKIVYPTIALLALVLAGFACYQNWHSHRLQQQQNENIARQLDTFKNQQQLEFKKAMTSIEGTQTKLQTHLQELKSNLQTALRQRLYQNQDWILLKVRYYLELAQINAHWSDNQKSTIAILQEADTLLKEIPSATILPIRQAIAKEIAEINAQPSTDIVGLLSQLDAARSTVLELPLKGSHNEPKKPRPQADIKSTWKTRLQSNLSFLKKLVIVHHSDKNIAPLFSPIYQDLLRESVRMNLQEAQTAILQNNATLYQRALKKAIEDIELSFEKNASSTQSLLTQLHQRMRQRPCQRPRTEALHHDAPYFYFSSRYCIPIYRGTTQSGSRLLIDYHQSLDS